MNGLSQMLRWSLNYQDGTKKSEFKEMDPSRKAFLEKALEQCMENSTKQQALRNAAINDLDSGDNNKVCEALITLENYLDIDPEFARSLINMNLIKPLTNCLLSSEPKVREQAAVLLALVLSNNSIIQDAFHQEKILNFLFDHFQEKKNVILDPTISKADDDYYAKMFSIVSTMSKGNKIIEQEIIQSGWLDLIKEMLSTKAVRLHNKLSSFIEFYALL